MSKGLKHSREPSQNLSGPVKDSSGDKKGTSRECRLDTVEVRDETPSDYSELLDGFGEEALEEKSDECTHPNFDEGSTICPDCCCEVHSLDFQQEWRFYGNGDNGNSKNTSRCVQTKDSSKGGLDKLFQELNLPFPSSIIKRTEKKYHETMGDQTSRGKGRRGIVAVCLYHVLRENNDIRTTDDLVEIFGIDKQKFSKALNLYYSKHPQDRSKIVRPVDMIRDMMTKNKIDMVHYDDIEKLTRLLEKSHKNFVRSSPQSVASACIYLYICLHPQLRKDLDINKSKFARRVGLSDITIVKLSNLGASILKQKVNL